MLTSGPPLSDRIPHKLIVGLSLPSGWFRVGFVSQNASRAQRYALLLDRLFLLTDSCLLPAGYGELASFGALHIALGLRWPEFGFSQSQ
jgi:hypothetical protein